MNNTNTIAAKTVEAPAEKLARLTVQFFDFDNTIRNLGLRTPKTDAAEKSYVAIHSEWKAAMAEYRQAREPAPLPVSPAPEGNGFDHIDTKPQE